MTWSNRFRVALGLLVILVLVAAFTLVLNRRITQVSSASASFEAESVELGTDYAGTVVDSFVKPGDAVTAGEPVIGGLHGASKHYFCGWCMSWLFTRPEGIDWFVNVRPTMLDDGAWSTPFIETWTSEALPWAKTAAVHSYEALPPMEAYEGLIREYAEWERG